MERERERGRELSQNPAQRIKILILSAQDQSRKSEHILQINISNIYSKWQTKAISMIYNMFLSDKWCKSMKAS